MSWSFSSRSFRNVTYLDSLDPCIGAYSRLPYDVFPRNGMAWEDGLHFPFGLLRFGVYLSWQGLPSASFGFPSPPP